jgi:hypothetical protein
MSEHWRADLALLDGKPLEQWTEADFGFYANFHPPEFVAAKRRARAKALKQAEAQIVRKYQPTYYIDVGQLQAVALEAVARFEKDESAHADLVAEVERLKVQLADLDARMTALDAKGTDHDDR